MWHLSNNKIVIVIAKSVREVQKTFIHTRQTNFNKQ